MPQTAVMFIGTHTYRRLAYLVAETVSGALAQRAIRRDRERGQGMVEYALILILIAVVVVLIVGVVGKQINNVFSNVSSGLAS